MFTTGDIITIVAILALVICFIVTLIKDKDEWSLKVKKHRAMVLF